MTSKAVSAGARGSRVTILGQFVKAVVNVASVVVLSRMLSPSDFGLVAMVAVTVSLGDLLRDFGMSTSGLRAKSLSFEQASNLFWINTLLGAIAALLVALASPFLVMIYNEPRLMAVTPVLAFSLLLNGLQAQIQVQLARQKRFSTLAVTDIAAQVFGLGGAIGGVALGIGYWALVVQTLVIATVLLVSRMLASRWLPSLPQRNTGSRALIRSGMNFGFAHGLTYVASNTDTVMIGALWGATSLGLYNRAYQLLTVPVSRLLAPLMNVIVPTINAVRDEGGDVTRLYLRIQSLVGMGNSLIFALALGTADSLIPLALGLDWDAAVPLFKILSIGGFALGLSQVSYWIFVTEGRSKQLLYYNLITKTMTIVLVVIGAIISVEGAAWAYSAALLLSWPINVWWLARTAGINGPRFLWNGLHSTGAGLISASIVMLLPVAELTDSLWAQGAISILVVLICYPIIISTTQPGRENLHFIARSTVKAIKK